MRRERGTRNSMDGKMVSIILPTYNEVENIRQIIPLIHETLLPRTEYEIIVVDDDSLTEWRRRHRC
jgi:cellulose synthase/poly-beta-1,6-N-acetylglucosamine synthase-like glycosyltransferase